MHSEAPAKNVVIVANESLVDEASDHSRDDEEIFAQEDDLVRSLSPMLQMMRIWGLYFGRHGRFHICSQSQESQLQNTEQFECNAGGKHSTAQHGIYAKIVLLILWINVLRVTISLRGGQALDVSTISQSTLFLTYLQYAVMQTSYFIASHSGTLDQMLDRLRVTRKLAIKVRKFAKACVIYNLLAFALSVASGFYTIFLPDERISFVLTPFTTLISVDGIWLKMVKILVIVVGSFSLQACLLPFLMNIMLTAILLLLFREINNRFRSKLNHRGKFTGNLKAFRHRHQVLSEIVQTIDSFMRIGNVASIACQMIIVILLLFETAFIGYVDTLIAVIFYSTFLPIVLSLSTCIISGVMVNGTIHNLNNTLHDIDLSSLDENQLKERISATVLMRSTRIMRLSRMAVLLLVILSTKKLMMFQKRLSGEPIGFSVLGLFVITKTTILSILGSLLTYFLVVIQLTGIDKTIVCQDTSLATLTTIETWYTTNP